MPTVPGAGSVNPPLTIGTDLAIAAQVSALIQSAANSGATVVDNNSVATNGIFHPIVAGSPVLGVERVAAANVSAPAFQYFVVTDSVSQINVTAGGALNQAVLLGSGPIMFDSGGGSGTIVGGVGNKTISIEGGSNFDIAIAGNTASTVAIHMEGSAATGLSTVSAGLGNNTIDLGAQPTHITSTGKDTIAVSTGATTVQALGNAQVTLTGGSGKETLVNGADSALVTGSSGSATVLAGSGGATATGGTGGNNLLISGAGQAYLIGAGNGDLLIATSTQAMQVLEAGSGNETLLGSLSTMNNIFQAGPGNDLIRAGYGSDTIVAGSGSATVSGGAGDNDYLFNPTVAGGGQVTITDFAPGNDHVSLVGYSAPMDQPANLASTAQFIGTGSRVTLSDNTTITFLGLGSVSSNFFG